MERDLTFRITFRSMWFLGCSLGRFMRDLLEAGCDVTIEHKGRYPWGH
jgi:hypothetical protein